MMRRYHTGLYVIASITIVLLLLWGLDLSRSMAEAEPAGSYRADVNVLPKALIVNHPDTNTLVIFRSNRGLLVWKHAAHSGDDHLRCGSGGSDGLSLASSVILVTFRSSNGIDERPGSRMILIEEILIGGESSAAPMSPTRISRLVSYPFGG